MAILDEYDQKARFFPAALAGLPLAVLAASVLGLDALNSFSAGLGVAAVVSYVLAQLARTLGKRIQDNLWQAWGGEPVVQILEGHYARINGLVLMRYREKLTTLTGTAGDDKKTYAVWSLWLRNMTRNSFPLILQENIAYGFWRNSLGLKPIGICLAAVSIVTLLLYHGCPSCPLDLSRIAPFLNALPSPAKLGLALDILLLFFWIFGPTPKRTKDAAFSYAEQLLGAVDVLTHKP